MYIKTPLDPNAPSLQVHHVHWHVPPCVRNVCFSPKDLLKPLAFPDYPPVLVSVSIEETGQLTIRISRT